MKLSKAIKYSETEKSKVWNLGRLQGYNPHSGKLSDSGANLLLLQPKGKPNRLSFYTPKFLFRNGTASPLPSDGRHVTFSVRNGRLFLYQITFEPKSVRTKNHSPFTAIRFPKRIEPVHFRRFLSVLKNFLIENDYKFLPKIQVKDQDGFYKEIYRCLYPGLRIFDKKVAPESKPEVLSIFREKISFKDSIKKATGFYGKKNVKAFAWWIENKKNLRIYSIIKLKKIIPLDIIHKIMDGERISHQAGQYSGGFFFEIFLRKGFRELLMQVPQNSRNSLILEISTSKVRDFLVLDSLRCFKDFPDIRIPDDIKKDWQNLHDFIYEEHNKRSKEPRAIKYDDKIKAIDGVKINELEVILPDNTHKLIEWGQKLKHCVGTYGNMAVNGSSTILGIYKSSEIKYCVELKGGSVIQFRGKFNCEPEPEDQEKIINILKEYKIAA